MEMRIRAPLIAQQAPELPSLLRAHKLNALEFEEMKRALGRMPTFAELGIFSAMWSEHCSYKSSRGHLQRLRTTGENVVVGPGENAGVVRLAGKLCVAFKMESHNHPSYLEPFQGAATGVGGILRDVFCMGARPVALLNALRFGRAEHPRTEYLVKRAVAGIAHYGNCIGIPTVGGSLSFDACYDGNCLVNAMAVGLVHEERIFTGRASGQSNLVVYVGAATGRDGIHGATMASDAFASTGHASRAPIQVGDPFAGKLLLEATLEALHEDLVVGLQDMGAAGLASASLEMAARAGRGLEINLDVVPVRAEAMSAYELMLSESQERMLMVVAPQKWQALQAILEKWDLSFAVIGHVTDTERLQAVRHGVLEVDVPIDPLTTFAPRYDRPRRSVAPTMDLSFAARMEDACRSLSLREVAARCLRESGSIARIYEQYDHHIGTSTVLGPEAGGASVLWIRSEWTADQPYLGLALAAACPERMVAADAWLGSQHAVAKAVRMLIATGATPLALTDCLNFGSPEDPAVMQEFARAIDGIAVACNAWDVPAVSGNVSFYNASDGRNIHPTPMIGAVGRHPDVRRAVGAVASQEGEVVLLIGNGFDPTWGASLVAKVLGFAPSEGECGALDWDHEKKVAAALAPLIMRGDLTACRDVGAGGVLLTLFKVLIPHGFGGYFSLAPLASATCLPIKVALGEVTAAYLIVLAAHATLQDITGNLAPGIAAYPLGRAQRGVAINMDGVSWSLQELNESYEEFLGRCG